MSETPTPTLPTATEDRDFTLVPLDELLELPVHEMSPSELVAYVNICHTLQVSAQTRRAQLKKESVEVHGVAKTSKKKKSNIDLALDLFAKLGL